MKAFKFKIRKPSKAIVQRFEQTLSLCRELYNAALQERREAWKLNRIGVSYVEQANQLKEIKQTNPEYGDVHSQVLQDVLRRIDKTFKSFFKRVKRKEKAGFPRFKPQSRYDSFCFPQSGFSLTGNKLTLSKIGTVKIRLSRTVIGKVKTCTIKREVSGWFVIFTVEDEKQILPKTGKQIGIDVGIELFATLSDGTRIENFKYFESSQKRLRIAQRRVSRRKKGSNRRRKAVTQLKKIHQKIRNQRNDFQHKIANYLVKNYDLIAIEKLNILGMSKGILAKQIHDAAWSSFFQKLKYKAENAGRELKEVNPNGTSQTCICGADVKKNLSVRHHHCLSCGHSEHRDIVSAKVILKLGLGHNLKDVTYAAGQSVSLESPPKTVSV